MQEKSKEIGSRVKELRELSEISIDEMAEEFDITSQKYQK